MTLLLAYIVPLVLRNLCVLAAIMVLVVEEKFHALRQDKEIMSIDQASREPKNEMTQFTMCCAYIQKRSIGGISQYVFMNEKAKMMKN